MPIDPARRTGREDCHDLTGPVRARRIAGARARGPALFSCTEDHDPGALQGVDARRCRNPFQAIGYDEQSRRYRAR